MFRERRGLEDLDFFNIKKSAECGVHGQQSHSHSAGCVQELSPGHSATSHRPFYQTLSYLLDTMLLSRLRNGAELFARNDLRRNPSRTDRTLLHDVTATTDVGTCSMAVLSRWADR